MSIDLYLQNNDNLLPPDQVHIERVEASPYPDGRRIKVYIDVTPFRQRPNLEITISKDGARVAGTSVIETMTFKMEFNLHLRNITDPAGDYTVRVQLYYGDDAKAAQDTREVALHVPSADSDSNSESI